MSDKLLPGWFEAKDPSGKSYYYTADGKTSWDRPSAPTGTTPKTAMPAAVMKTSTSVAVVATTKPPIAGGMGSLLGEIQKGALLKKAETNDRSAPPEAGKPVTGNEVTTGTSTSRPSSTGGGGGGGGGGVGGGGSLMEQIANAKLKKASAPVAAASTGDPHVCDTSY